MAGTLNTATMPPDLREDFSGRRLSEGASAILHGYPGPLVTESSFASMMSAGFVDPLEYNQESRKESCNLASSNLQYLNLKGRDLAELPMLGKEAAIRSLDLSHNKISKLETAPDELPESLQVLSLTDNKLLELCQLKYLTACTSLVELDITNNPVTEGAARIGFDLRPFVQFLLPGMRRFNGADVKEGRILESSRKLFTDGQGRLSDTLLELLDEGRQVELTHYLSQQCPLTRRPRHVDSAPSTPRVLQTPKPLARALPFDETPVGSSNRRGVSYSGPINEEIKNVPPAKASSARRGGRGFRGDLTEVERGFRSPKKNLPQPALLGDSSPAAVRVASPRSPGGRDAPAKAKMIGRRPVAVDKKKAFATLPGNGAEAFVAKSTLDPNQHLASNTLLLETVGGNGLGRAEQQLSRSEGLASTRARSNSQVAEKEVVKRLVTIEKRERDCFVPLGTRENGNFSDNGAQLSGVRKEWQHELADVWEELQRWRDEADIARTELTQIRTEMQRSRAGSDRARAELRELLGEASAARTELATVRLETERSRAELANIRTALGKCRSEADKVRTGLLASQEEPTLGEVRAEVLARTAAEADARALLEEVLRRMWGECAQLRAWRDAHVRREWERAAVRVQRFWRVWRARRLLEGLKDEREREEEMLLPHVIRIQASARGFLARQRTAQLRMQTAAAVRIQSVYRQHVQRRKCVKKMQKARLRQQELEALRVQVYHMQIWMHQMATSIAGAGAPPMYHDQARPS